LTIKWQVFKPDRGNARANGGLLWRVQPQYGDIVVKEGPQRDLKRKQLLRFYEVLPESQGQNLALTVLCLPYSRANGGLLWRVQPQYGDIVVKEGRHPSQDLKDF